MEKSEFRVLIKHYFLRKKTITETKKSLDKYYGESSPSLKMIHKWFTEFRCGRTSTEDAPRSGRPIEVTTPEMITKIHDIVSGDRRVKLREIAKTVNISYERVSNILHEHLHMKKLSARWVPGLLTIDQQPGTVMPYIKASGDECDECDEFPAVVDKTIKVEIDVEPPELPWVSTYNGTSTGRIPSKRPREQDSIDANATTENTSAPKPMELFFENIALLVEHFTPAKKIRLQGRILEILTNEFADEV